MKQVYIDILNNLKNITKAKYFNVWNNQVEYMNKGDEWQFPLPAIFIEIENPQDKDQLIGGTTTTTLRCVFHIVYEFYNGQDATFEQNLGVFGIRDELVSLFYFFIPSSCGAMQFISESQDYNHNNITHYTVIFNMQYIENANNKLNKLTLFKANDAQITSDTQITSLINLYGKNGVTNSTRD